MNPEKPPQNSNKNSKEHPLNGAKEGRFNRMPGEAKTEEEKQELDKRYEEANQKLEKEKNEKFLEENQEFAEVAQEYRRRLGEKFKQQENEIISNVRKAVNYENALPEVALEEQVEEKFNLSGKQEIPEIDISDEEDENDTQTV